jgi:hypothetical protein
MHVRFSSTTTALSACLIARTTTLAMAPVIESGNSHDYQTAKPFAAHNANQS